MPEGAAPLPGSLSRQRYGVLAGIAAFLTIMLVPAPAGMPVEAWRTAAMALLMAIWWITDAIPVYATALVPLVLIPLLGIADIGTAAAPYSNPVVFLFLGGALIAVAIQRWNLHQRVGLALLSLAGTGARQLVGGFMMATALVSMWVSNTAAALIMLPMATAVLALLKECGDAASVTRDLDTALLLGVAYGASIGGMATLVGTPPNALLVAYLEQTHGIAISFAAWLAFGLPLASVLLLIAWLLLTRVAYRLPTLEVRGAAEAISARRAALGPVTRGERIVAVVLGLVAGAWMLVPLINDLAPALRLSDAGVAMVGAVALFVLPVDWRRGVFALDWASTAKVPWGVLILLGGGLSLAEAISFSGLAQAFGSWLVALDRLPEWLLLLTVIGAVVFLTEMTSNTATTATLLPVAAALAIALDSSPLLLCVPVALAASCAFMLPAATPPNAVVFGSGRVTVPEMARAGLYLNAACIAVLFAATVLGVLSVLDGMTATSSPEMAP